MKRNKKVNQCNKNCWGGLFTGKTIKKVIIAGIGIWEMIYEKDGYKKKERRKFNLAGKRIKRKYHVGKSIEKDPVQGMNPKKNHAGIIIW